jgi:hypothetical protein
MASRRAEPRKVDEMELKAFRKGAHDWIPPTPRASESVYEHGGMPRARDPVAHRHPTDLARSLLEHDTNRFS